MRALVLGGAGAVCSETTRDLAQYSNFDEIVVADINYDAIVRLVTSIGDSRVKALLFDASTYGNLLNLFPEFDIVVNGLPFNFDYSVNKACVESGVNGLDLSSDDPQFDLHAQALEKNMIFVPGVGATPGITNMMVRRATHVVDTIETADIYFAAFRCLAPAPGLLQTTLWEFNPEEDDRLEVYFENGEWHSAPPLSGGVTIQFHEHIGEQVVYYVPHDESNTLPRSYPGLKRAAVRGCFPPHIMELMSALMRGGLLTSMEIDINGLITPVIDVVSKLLLKNPVSKENPIWGYGLVVEITGRRNNRNVRCTYRSHHPSAEDWGGEAAYYKNVGIPLSIGAQLIANGMVDMRGVLPPELAFPVDPFFMELAKRGITVEEIIVEEGHILSNR